MSLSWHGHDRHRPLHRFLVLWISRHQPSYITLLRHQRLFRVNLAYCSFAVSSIIVRLSQPHIFLIIIDCTVHMHCTAGHRTAFCLFPSTGVFLWLNNTPGLHIGFSIGASWEKASVASYPSNDASDAGFGSGLFFLHYVTKYQFSVFFKTMILIVVIPL
jgi:hypothetical protein